MTTYQFKKLHPDHLTITDMNKKTTVAFEKIRCLIKHKMIECLKLETVRTTCYLIPPTEIDKVAAYKNVPIDRISGGLYKYGN